MKTRNFVLLSILSFCLACSDNNSKTSSQVKSEPIKIMTVGGGSSHDYDTWFNRKDSETLASLGVDVYYTEDVTKYRSTLDTMDVLFITHNQPIESNLDRDAILSFADAGRSLMLVHPPVWYNWEDWPQWNNNFVGGGSRGHGPYGVFTVEVVDSSHPVMEGVELDFEIEDELYRVVLDENMAATHILAQALDTETGETHPLVWVVEHPTAKVLCIALGHDAAAHNNPNYQKLIRNGVSWLAAN